MQGKQPYGCVAAKHHFWSLTVGLNRNEKQAVVEEISAKIASAQTIALAEYRGIQVGQMTQLRSKARDQGVYLRVLKNTLARRAVEGTTFSGLANDMTGPLIYAISDDAVAAAKVLSDFAKGNDKLVIRSGNYAGKPLDKAGVAALANIPSREVLLSQLMGIMQAPVSGFARALAALAEKNGGGAPAEAAAPAEAG
jgi:large subunit ribosomal protein L10